MASREKLLEVAAEQFAARGFWGTSVRDLALASETSVSTIYHHFGNKEGVLVALFREASRSLSEALGGAVESVNLAAEDRLRLLLHAHLRFVVGQPALAMLYVLDVSGLSVEVASVSKAAQQQIFDLYTFFLEQLQAAGYLAERDVKVTVLSIFGVLNWFVRWHRLGGPLSPDELIEVITDFVEYGIGNAGATPAARQIGG